MSLTSAGGPATSDGMPGTRGLNFYREDRSLQLLCSLTMPPEVFARAEPHLIEMGRVAGGELDRLAAEADRNPPVLRGWDERGARIDEIVRHPAYREMERLAFARFGLAAMSHRAGVLGWPTPVPHVVKYALSYLFAQSEFGLLCPVSLTDSTARMLRMYGSAELQAAYLPRLTATDFDQLWQGTQWMTERTGGSDVGQLATAARRGPDGRWRLWGDKWFCSNANADLALTLARPEGAPAGTRGLGMFLVPRDMDDGARNAWTIHRLKDKFGSRSMATGEVTYDGALAHPVGDLARGFAQMMEMVNVSRLSNAMRAAGLMRRALLESLVHARGRLAFGRPLIALPLLRANLLEMLLDVEAAASVVIRAAAMLDRWDAGSSEDRRLFRIVTPLAKCWITDRARAVTAEAMNVRGGNGYIEEWVNPRLVRDSFLGAIWEGSTSVVALDVQRVIMKDGGHDALLSFVDGAIAGVSAPAAKPLVDALRQESDAFRRRVDGWPGLAREDLELQARPASEALYHLLAAGLLLVEGEALRARTGDCRKLLVAALYLRRWLRPPPPGHPRLIARDLAWVDRLVEWVPVPDSALTALPAP